MAGAESPWRCETVTSFPQRIWENSNFLWPLSGSRWASLILLLWDKHVNHIVWVNSDGLNEWICQSLNPDSRVLVQTHLHHPLIMSQCSSLTSPGLSFPLCENWFTRSSKMPYISNSRTLWPGKSLRSHIILGFHESKRTDDLISLAQDCTMGGILNWSNFTMNHH